MQLWSFLLDLFRALADAWRFVQQPTTRSGLGAAGVRYEELCRLHVVPVIGHAGCASAWCPR